MTDDLSWQRGPANSRSVRALCYLSWGSLGGAIVFMLADLAYTLGRDIIGGAALATGALFLLFLLFVAHRMRVVTAAVRSARAGSGERSERRRLFDEFRAVVSVPLVAAVAVVVGGVPFALGYLLLGSEGLYWWLLAEGQTAPIAYSTVFLPCWLLASFLTASGRIDPEEMAFTYGHSDPVDLAYLSGVRRLDFGSRSILWLSFAPGPGSTSRPIYLLPRDVADRASPIFERGIAAEPAEIGIRRPSRSVLYAGLLVFGGSGALLFAMFYLESGSFWGAAYVALYPFGIFAVLLLASYFGLLR